MNNDQGAGRMARRFRGFLPVVVDVETGGFNCARDALLQIAAVMIDLDDAGRLVREAIAMDSISSASKAAASASLVSMSTERSARRNVEIGFRNPRTRNSAPFVTPPSRPPARFVCLTNSCASPL